MAYMDFTEACDCLDRQVENGQLVCVVFDSALQNGQALTESIIQPCIDLLKNNGAIVEEVSDHTNITDDATNHVYYTWTGHSDTVAFYAQNKAHAMLLRLAGPPSEICDNGLFLDKCLCLSGIDLEYSHYSYTGLAKKLREIAGSLDKGMGEGNGWEVKEV